MSKKPRDESDAVSGVAEDEQQSADDPSDSADRSDSAIAPDIESEDGAADLEEKLAQALDQRLDFEKKYIRAAAELQNAHKQAAGEVSNARKYAIDRFATELLGVLESFDRAHATGSIDDDSALEQLQEGLQQTHKQLVGVLSRFSVAEIEAQPGDKFDPAHHEAMMMQPTSEFEPNHIVSVVRKGYRIHERLLRAAMVIVASAPVANERKSADSGSAESSEET